MEFSLGGYGLALAAGGLSTLSPCVLPLLPIVLTTALAAHRLGPLALATGLTLSFTALGVFIASIGIGLGLDQAVFRAVAAILLLAFGIVLLSASLQTRFTAATSALADAGESLLARVSLTGLSGQFILGLLLGIIWSPCVGPTLGATVTLASQGENLGEVALMMLVFGLGASLPLMLLGWASREAIARFRGRLMSTGKIGRQVLGAIMLLLGATILSGVDKSLESWLLQHAPDWLIRLTVSV